MLNKKTKINIAIICAASASQLQFSSATDVAEVIQHESWFRGTYNAVVNHITAHRESYAVAAVAATATAVAYLTFSNTDSNNADNGISEALFCPPELRNSWNQYTAGGLLQQIDIHGNAYTLSGGSLMGAENSPLSTLVDYLSNLKAADQLLAGPSYAFELIEQISSNFCKYAFVSFDEQSCTPQGNVTIHQGNMWK
ncbi:hypothetical protein [Candidatus Odyssella acanthamoebae]|uniref:Uncharacterized protein n=1 Tax=Candidatus Odyssella acanthamoebae TaxID=91604 RepID=A0A077ATJ1_9PROT|nr:hypothetical protein [Candidatus Paracaedibacter acanthamoebae]AIK96492.1 hypothetical protein ID47_06655 [Candidatus Paracaedibacter acanthamoebae]